MNSLFNLGNFKLHSGAMTNFKIDCDKLTMEDLDSLAYIIAQKYEYDKVIGIPNGGLKLARHLTQYSINNRRTLIVDDVLTTGNSFEVERNKIKEDCFGIVIFARGRCPNWVIPIFELNTNWKDIWSNDFRDLCNGSEQ